MQDLGPTNWFEPATLVQEAPGSRNDFGEWVSGAKTSTAIQVITAPSSGGMSRLTVPEGARLTDYRTFYVSDVLPLPLRVGAKQSGADVILYDGTAYCVKDVDDWRPHGFAEVLAVRAEGQAS